MIDYGRLEASRSYLFADAVEIYCAFDRKGPVSETDIFSLLTSSIRSSDELLNFGDNDLDDNDYDDSLTSAEITETEQLLVSNCLEQLEFRRTAFKTIYPFTLEEGLLCPKSVVSDIHRLYLLLLAAARSRTFKKRGFPQKIAGEFETICKQALAELMPKSARTVTFAANSEDRRELFGTDLRNALPALAKFMGMDMAPCWQSEDISSSGDAKIDLVGVQQLDDLEGGWHVFLGQCAAQEDENNWEAKRSEADFAYHQATFHSKVPSTPVLFVPGCFRKANGAWAKPDKTSAVILMDRLRILLRLENNQEAQDRAANFLSLELGYS